MKKSILCVLLMVAETVIFPSCLFAAAKDQVAQERLENLISANAVPDYVAQQGLFECNTDVAAIIMTSDGVNLRSQPNAKAHSLGKLNRYYPGVLAYSGTWTHPKDKSRWYIGVYMPKHPDKTGAISAWVNTKYAKAVTAEEFNTYQSQQFKAHQQRQAAAAAKKQQQSRRTAKARKVDRRVFQCTKCGQYWNMNGQMERMSGAMDAAFAEALGPMAGLFGVQSANNPPQRQCRFGGYHVWQRIR